MQPIPNTPWDHLHAQGKASAPETFSCSVEPADLAIVQRLGDVKRDARIAVYTKSGSETVQVILKPSDARRMAAALLNAADEADGTTPLVFLPEAVRKGGRRK